MNSPDEQGQTAHEPIKEGPLRFVAELADEHDYWMSLTDAARITRTSEAMARRWVTSGRLPTKQEPVGINQRTRLVRASDVARIRPIIDPSAAITDELHKLDLPSIPRQQMQIMQEQTQLAKLLQSLQQVTEDHIVETRTALEQGATKLHQQVQEWDRQLSTHDSALQHALDLQHQQHAQLATQVQDQAQHIQQSNDKLQEYRQHYQHDLEQLRTTTSNQFKEMQVAFQAAQQEVQQQLAALAQDHHTHIDQIQREFTSHLQQQEKFQQVLQATEAHLKQHDQEHKQAQQDLAAMQRSLATYQEASTTHIEQQAQQVKLALDQQLSEQAQENAALHKRIEGLEHRLEQVGTQAETTSIIVNEYKKYVDIQEQRMQKLSAMLSDETKARELLSTQLAAQREPTPETVVSDQQSIKK